MQNCRLFALSLGGSANGVTSLADDCALADAGPTATGWPTVVLGSVGNAGQGIVLSATSAWDNFLLLLGADGSLVGIDEDSGAGTNARIAVTLPNDGIYLAILAPYVRETQ